jgi:2-iminobutanoate/2-iminopropanoate deaminase
MAIQYINVGTGIPGIPFSNGTKAGDYIFASGQIGHVDSKGNKLVGIEAQTRQAMENIKAVLKAAGASFDNLVKTTIFLTNRNDFAKMNEVYRSYFTKNFPARSTFIISGMALPEMLIEIECIGYLPK